MLSVNHANNRCRLRGWLLGLGLALLVVMGGVASREAVANIVLIRFEATAYANNTVLVLWETATELNVAGFRLYRTAGSPGGWGDMVYETRAQGDGLVGAVYTYVDEDIMPGVRYDYMLEELMLDGTTQGHGPISASIDLPTGTVTPTAPTPTATVPPVTPLVRSRYLPYVLR